MKHKLYTFFSNEIQDALKNGKIVAMSSNGLPVYMFRLVDGNLHYISNYPKDAIQHYEPFLTNERLNRNIWVIMSDIPLYSIKENYEYLKDIGRSSKYIDAILYIINKLEKGNSIEEELKDKNKNSAEQKEWRILSGHICPKCNTKTLFICTKSSNLSFICNTNDEVKCKLCGISGHWIWENEDFGYIEFD